MLGAIRRVISEADDMGNDTTQGQVTIASAPAAVAAAAGDVGAGQSPSPGANVVEPDTNNNMDLDAPVALVAHRSNSETLSTSSSLSDTSSAAAAIAEMQNEQREVLAMDEADDSGVAKPLKRSERKLQRMDSANESIASGSQRESSQTSSRDWGWFEDVHQASDHNNLASPGKRSSKTKRKGLVPQHSGGSVGEIVRLKDNDTSAMAVTAPTYVLEESLSAQRLWKDTAGQRPPQPVEERAFYEKMWAQNFARSQVNYSLPVEVLTATSPISLSPFADGNFEGPNEGNELSNYNLASLSTQKGPDSDVAEAALVSRMNKPANSVAVNQQKGDMTVLVRGDNVFGTTVSKSFTQVSERAGPIGRVDTVNISIASYRVVDTKKGGKFAQYLVIYREGSIRDTVGVWKRYSDFEELARKVTQQHEGCAAVIANMSPLAVTEEPETEHLPNAITSWRLLKKRQRWYRCLDAGYLSLKVFLLERFLHDILFESTSPQLLRDFVLGDDME